jgi:RNA polymerase sigma factor (sigma-70 family)
MDNSEQLRRFDAWTSEHAAILERTARGFARGADREDLLQELLLAVWKAIPAYRGGSSVATFLYRVAHNAALTWNRARKSRLARDERVALTVGPQEKVAPAETDGPDRSDGETDRQLLESLYAAIHGLHPVDRSLMLLSLDGMTYADMAALHGMSIANVGVRLTRARQTLAHELRPHDSERSGGTP